MRLLEGRGEANLKRKILLMLRWLFGMRSYGGSAPEDRYTKNGGSTAFFTGPRTAEMSWSREMTSYLVKCVLHWLR